MANSMMPMERIAVSTSRCEYMCPGDDDENAVGRLSADEGSGGSWSFAADNSLSNALDVLCKAIRLQDLWFGLLVPVGGFTAGFWRFTRAYSFGGSGGGLPGLSLSTSIFGGITCPSVENCQIFWG